MKFFTRLADAIAAELALGRLGQPVFLRLLASLSDDHGHLLPALSEGVALGERIFGTTAASLLATGGLESGHISVQLDLRGGQTALLAVALRGGGPLHLDLLLIGNHGTLRHEHPGDAILPGGESLQPEQYATTPRGEAVRQAILLSLQTHQPVVLSREG